MNSPIRRILVPLDPSGFAEAAMRQAGRLARRHGAQVEGLVVLDTPGIRSDIAPVEMVGWPLVYDYVKRAMEDAEGEMTRLKEKFATFCDEHRVSHAEAEMEGVPADLILRVASLFDLIVIGLRTYFHFETRKGPGESLDRILDRTVTPVLAVPEEGPDELRRVLVAYDGSFASSRALRDCVAVLRGADIELTLFCSDPDESQAGELARHAAAYLRAHDFRSFAVVTTREPAMEVVNRDFLDKTDLIVAGIHARRFLKDAFVGSFTNQLIRQGRTALLLSH